MKYEISQEQYADFLNHLTVEQQTTRSTAGPSADAGTHALATGSSFRNGIRLYQPASSEAAATFGCDLASGQIDPQYFACQSVFYAHVIHLSF